MENVIKLEQEELQLITQIQQVTKNIVIEYGNIELGRKALEARTKTADDALQALRDKEQEIANQLKEKYGEGSINLEEGTFLPVENSPAREESGE